MLDSEQAVFCPIFSKTAHSANASGRRTVDNDTSIYYDPAKFIADSSLSPERVAGR